MTTTADTHVIKANIVGKKIINQDQSMKPNILAAANNIVKTFKNFTSITPYRLCFRFRLRFSIRYLVHP